MTEETPSKRARCEKNALDSLKCCSVVVADTGEVASIKKFSPEDATTNPSLILKAAVLPEYASLVSNAIVYAQCQKDVQDAERLGIAMDQLAVNFGLEISKIVPGYISTEVDARLSFDTNATVTRARRLIAMYADKGVDKSRILIKIASTYEGIRAGEILQREGISCNLTLLFSLVQAAGCAEAGITLISPFVGRILDWHKAKTGKTYTASEDPGVLSVKNIYQYLKKFNYGTIVMGASFRNVGEILELAGCDRLTIAPILLDELQGLKTEVPRVLEPITAASEYKGDKLPVDEANFRFQLNEDPMATEKLAEGIRAFAADIIKLENIIKAQM